VDITPIFAFVWSFIVSFTFWYDVFTTLAPKKKRMIQGVWSVDPGYQLAACHSVSIAAFIVFMASVVEAGPHNGFAYDWSMVAVGLLSVTASHFLRQALTVKGVSYVDGEIAGLVGRDVFIWSCSAEATYPVFDAATKNRLPEIRRYLSAPPHERSPALVLRKGSLTRVCIDPLENEDDND
jgi:hypothetical protein